MPETHHHMLKLSKVQGFKCSTSTITHTYICLQISFKERAYFYISQFENSGIYMTEVKLISF